LRANNADALMPSLLAGHGLAVQPDFLVRDDIAAGRLEIVLPTWTLPEIALHLVMPPGGPRPARIEAFADFLTRRFSKSARGRTKSS
jgi:DNA-binding transcriptional LysR family regulator